MSIAAPAAQTGSSAATPTLVLDASGGDTLIIPLGGFLLTATYARMGGDLLLTGPGGEPSVLVRDFFTIDNPPALSSENGAIVWAALAMRLAGARAPGQFAAAGDIDEAQPIGRVAEIDGTATATRVDGTKVALSKDTPVYQGDIIETANGAALSVVFIDESTFSVGENGRMVLDEMVFDPSTLEGGSAVSVLQGVFVFVSGEIAANNPEQMVIRTPVATIGIRGTAVAISAAQEGEQNKVVLLTEQTPDGQTTTGAVVITNQAGTVVLDQAFETTLIDSAFSAPTPSYVAPPDEVTGLVGQVGKAAPDSVQHLAPPAPSDHQAGGPGPSEGAGPSQGVAGEPGAPGDGGPPGAAAEGEPAPDTAPLDESLFAEEAGLFEDAALVVDGLLAEDAKPPPDEAGPLGPEAALYDDAPLATDGLSPLTEPALAEVYGAGVPAPPPDGGGFVGSTGYAGSGGTLGGYGYADGTLTGDPLAADNLSGGIGVDTLGDFGSYTTVDSFTFGFDPTYAGLTGFFAPPPPSFTSGTSNDQFLPPPSTILSGLTLIGTSANETFIGSDLNDFIDGRGGDDSLFGLAGNDVLIGGGGNDLIDGGDGLDVVDYSGTTSGGITVNLGSGFASGGSDVGVDSLVSIEFVHGTVFGDTLTGSSGDNIFKSGGGSDLMTGGGGNDLYVIEGVGGPAILTVNDSGDSSPADVLELGSPGNDALPIDFDYTVSGSNLTIRHVLGDPANEQLTILSHLTTGTIEFFAFIDPDIASSSLSLQLHTGGGTANGTTGADFIAVGDAVGTTVNGGDGNDFLIGNGGSDVIAGGLGADEINGNGGGDTLDGGAGDDNYLIIPTAATTEIITDSAGTDSIEVGGTIGFKARNNGTDLILEFTNGATASVLSHLSGSPVEILEIVDGLATYLLATGTSGTAGSDLIAGGTGTQTLTGAAGDDLLYGAGGADALLGGGGFDILVGGAGVDTLTGGTEADRFRYFDPAEGAAATNGTSGQQSGDQISDFQSGLDRFEFLNSTFGFGTSAFAAVNGSTFFTVLGYDGTNAGASGTAQPHFIFDPTSLTLYHDDGNSGTGYTVIATVQAGGLIAAGDVHVSSLGGGSAY